MELVISRPDSASELYMDFKKDSRTILPIGIIVSIDSCKIWYMWYFARVARSPPY